MPKLQNQGCYLPGAGCWWWGCWDVLASWLAYQKMVVAYTKISRTYCLKYLITEFVDEKLKLPDSIKTNKGFNKMS